MSDVSGSPVLVTGGAGYIGSHVVLALHAARWPVTRVSGRALAVEERPRRPGDAPAVVADAERIREAFGWRPRYDQIEQIVCDALAFERRRPDGVQALAREDAAGRR